jgi:hypothetical protein
MRVNLGGMTLALPGATVFVALAQRAAMTVRPVGGTFYGNGPGQHGYACSDVPQDPPGQDRTSRGAPLRDRFGAVDGRSTARVTARRQARRQVTAVTILGSAHLRARSLGRCRVASVTLWQGRRVVMGLRGKGLPERSAESMRHSGMTR